VPQLDSAPMFAPGLAQGTDGFDPASFDGLAQVEDGHFWFVPRSRLITQLIARDFPDARSFLEIGCGNGAVLSAIAKLRHWTRLAGSELHPLGLANAKRRLNGAAEFVQMDARHIPAQDAFDVIGAFDVLEHVEEDETVLASMHRAVAPGGGVIIAVPQHKWLWSRTDEVAHHARRYGAGELDKKMTAAGFHITFSSSYAAALLPLMAAGRLLARRNTGQPVSKQEAINCSHAAELNLPGPLNAILKAILHAEVTATLAGLRWPAGGSRIVIGRKF
jgi:SAM-dependent methyltransferase